MSDPAETPARLNLFALPSLTTLLFALIAGVILVAVFAGLRQNPSALGVMIAAGVAVLPLRDFLRRPERDLRTLGVPQPEKEPPPPEMVHEVEAAAHTLGLDRPPRLFITPRPIVPATLGTWRRRYLVMGQSLAGRWEKLPDPAQRALWLHEVGHFVNGDHWKVGLARSLLRVSVLFMSWSAFFLLGVTILAFVYGLEVFEPGYLDTLPLEPTMRDTLALFWSDPAQMAPLLEQARETHVGLAALYVLDAHLPFVLSGAVLLLFVWRRLVQVREFYADARVAARMGDAEEARRALEQAAEAAIPLGAGTSGENTPPRLQMWLARLRGGFDRLLPFHPGWKERFACLDDPARAFGDWKWAGFTAGLAVLLLNVILVGPFTFAAYTAGPAHFATLPGLVILALWLLPGTCQGLWTTTRQMVGQVVKAGAMFTSLQVGWLILNSGLVLALLIFAPELLSEMLNAMLLTGNKVLSPSSLPLPEDPVTLALWAIGGGWSFTALVLACLLACLLLVGLLLRRLLTWYAYPNASRHLPRIAWSAILVVALILSLVILPLPTALIQGNPASFLQPTSLAAAGVTLLLALGWGARFLRANRRYGRRCPCGGRVPGWFELGKRCPACGESLHPWLLAGY